MVRVYGLIFIKLGNRARKYAEYAPEPKPGRIRGVKLTSFCITNAIDFCSSVTGFPGQDVENVIPENITFEYLSSPAPDQIFETVPEHEKRYPEITLFSKRMPVRNYLPAYGLMLYNFRVNPVSDDRRPKYRVIDVKNMQIDDDKN